MRWSPSVTVAAVVRRHDHYLMVEERPEGTSVLNQPAGHLEFGETLLDAIEREVLEETGRPFTPEALVGVYQWTRPDTEHTYLRFCFRGHVGEPLPGRALDPDIRAVHWMTLDQIVGSGLPPRSPLVLRCIEDERSSSPVGLQYLHALV